MRRTYVSALACMYLVLLTAACQDDKPAADPRASTDDRQRTRTPTPPPEPEPQPEPEPDTQPATPPEPRPQTQPAPPPPEPKLAIKPETKSITPPPAAIEYGKGKLSLSLDEQVEASTQKAIDYLWSQQNTDERSQFFGSWIESKAPPARPRPQNAAQAAADTEDLPHYIANPKHAVGTTGLIVYGLLEAGVDPGDPRMVNALEWLCRQDDVSRVDRRTVIPPDPKDFHGLQPTQTYDLACRASALCAAIRNQDNEAYERVLRMDLSRLMRGAYRGAYSYTSAGHSVSEDVKVSDDGRLLLRDRKSRQHNFARAQWDSSNTQYGVLGMWAAMRVDFETPRTYWVATENFWARTQNSDGGWGYRPNLKPLSYPPMTVAGIASLYVAMDNMDREQFRQCNTNTEQLNIKRGMMWLAKRLPGVLGLEDPAEPFPTEQVGPFAPNLYFLYGLERVGVASGYKYIGNIDWYVEGAKIIVKGQGSDGAYAVSDLQGGKIGSTALGLLFLAGGRRPVLWNKLKYAGDWNNRPRNLAKLVRWINEQYERKVKWQTITIDAPVEEWHDAPILCISGSVRPELTDEQIAKLREFVYQGGTIFSMTECDGGEFRRGIRGVYERMFPDRPLVEAPDDHPLYNIQHTLNGRPKLHIISNGVRPLVIHTDADVSVAWQFQERDTQPHAFQVAANIFMTVTDRGMLYHRGQAMWPAEVALRQPAADGEKPEAAGKRNADKDEDQPPVARATLKVVRVRYDGNWNPEPLALERFRRLMAMHLQVDVKVLDAVPAEALTDSGATTAFLTGTGGLTLSTEQKAGLRKFVEGGGTLLMDAAGGDVDFYDAAAGVLAEVFEASPAPLQIDADIYRVKLLTIDKVRYRPATLRRRPERHEPRLEAITVSDRPAVILSREDLTAGLAGYPAFGVDGYAPGTAAEPGDAYRIVRNVTLYATGLAETAEPEPAPQPDEEP